MRDRLGHAAALIREHRVSLEADQYFTGPPGRGYLSFGQAPMLVQLATLGDS